MNSDVLFLIYLVIGFIGILISKSAQNTILSTISIVGLIGSPFMPLLLNISSPNGFQEASLNFASYLIEQLPEEITAILGLTIGGAIAAKIIK